MTIARSLIKSIKLPERVPQSRGGGGGGGGGLFGGILSSGVQGGIDAYEGSGAVFGPVSRVCDAVSLTKWSLYQQTEKAGEIGRELIDDAEAPARHPATAIWTQCNPFMTRSMFLYIQQLWQETCGGVYWLMVQGGSEGSPFLQKGVTADIELWPIRSDRIFPVPDPDRYIGGYVYKMGTEVIPLPVQAVIPIGRPSPRDPLKFAGALQSIMTGLEAEQLASQYQRNAFLNSGRPGGVLEFENYLEDTRFNEIVTRWREQHMGVNNAARVAVIEGGHWVETAHTNEDMQFIDLRRFAREEVMYAIGMPFAMMVTQEVNLANAVAGEKNFNRWTLRPRNERIKEPLNLRVMPYLGDNLSMGYEMDSPEDEAFDVYASSVGWLAGLLRKNEARAGLGYDAIDGEDGDKFVNEITGVAPQIPPATPPKKPTTLSYRKAHPAAAEHERRLTGTAAEMLEQVREQYEALLRGRN